ncbi:uncharacterized protein LOC111209600 [Brassica napus]|nr:uncharacterized protein LOC111209600 [Brassica napus]
MDMNYFLIVFGIGIAGWVIIALVTTGVWFLLKKLNLIRRES